MAATFVTNERDSRFELQVDGEVVGYLEYRPAGPSVILTHTEVPAEHEGNGYGGRLVRGAVEAARADDRTVIPTCSFAISYIRRHPELAEAVDPSLRDRF